MFEPAVIREGFQYFFTGIIFLFRLSLPEKEITLVIRLEVSEIVL